MGMKLKAQDYQLVWSDEFNYTGLPDDTKWNYDVGGHGWGNNELQYYTEKRTENARVENGNLIIEAKKESYGGNDYTSARLVSRQKGDWLYGKIEVRAMLPSGKGTWPAIWMLPTDWSYGDWPASGEIDIMEHVGYEPTKVHGSVHTEAYNHSINTQKTASYTVDNCETAFHIYSIEWTADKIDFFVDGTKYFTFNNEGSWDKWPFDKRFHLIFNIAVGGNWGGVEGVDDQIFPQQMQIDYVRVYQPVGEIILDGADYVEPNEANVVFTATNVSGASYKWTVPEGVQINGSNTANEISVDWGTIEGSVKLEYSKDGTTKNLEIPVKLVTVPENNIYKFDDFDDNSTQNIIIDNSGANKVYVNEENNELKVEYDVQDKSDWPHFKVKSERPVKLDNHGYIRVALKTFNQSNSVFVRIDLADIDGIATNKTPVFKLEPIYDDGNYHIYEFDFTDGWGSDYPNQGATVNKSRISEAIVYFNYGVYGQDNKQDEFWLDYIEFVDPNTTDIQKISKNGVDFKIFPNPTQSALFIASEKQKIETIDIYSINGKQYYHQENINKKNQSIDINNLKTGIYILRLTSENDIITKKLIKK